MGNSLFNSAYLIFPSEDLSWRVNDGANFNISQDFWDPSTVEGISQKCVDIFQDGKMGVDYSSFPLKLHALLQNGSINSRLFIDKASTGVTFSNFGCSFDKSTLITHCDFESLYKHVKIQCEVIETQGGLLEYKFNEDDDYEYHQGTCNELFGVQDSVNLKNFNPDKDWCPSYYDGKEGGEVSYGRLEMKRDRVEGSFENSEFDDMIDNAYESESEFPDGTLFTFIVDNIPYCTAFDSCTEEEFFKMTNAEAAAYSNVYYNEANADWTQTVTKMERIEQKKGKKDGKKTKKAKKAKARTTKKLRH